MALVKICGITRIEDAESAIDLGADLLGLNFYPKSQRFLPVEKAREIARGVRGRVPLVGVFVNSSPQEVREIERAVGLDLLQFHGDEGREELLPWGDRAIRVLRLEAAPDPSELEAYAFCWGFLFEPRHGEFGGSGKAWEYSLLSELASQERQRPFLVAGGIGPGSARRALRESGTDGVDVCSGVESAPGIKDRSLMERLMMEVQDGESLIA